MFAPHDHSLFQASKDDCDNSQKPSFLTTNHQYYLCSSTKFDAFVVIEICLNIII